MATTVYMDLCCLNRPFDDQGQDRIRLESEAVTLVLSRVERGHVDLLASDVLELENTRNPDGERREYVAALLGAATTRASVDESVSRRAGQLQGLGFHAFDALHLAAAEAGGADVFLATDDQLLACAQRNADALRLEALNPVEWIREADR